MVTPFFFLFALSRHMYRLNIKYVCITIFIHSDVQHQITRALLSRKEIYIYVPIITHPLTHGCLPCVIRKRDQFDSVVSNILLYSFCVILRNLTYARHSPRKAKVSLDECLYNF
jgi:hypothetical protein